MGLIPLGEEDVPVCADGVCAVPGAAPASADGASPDGAAADTATPDGPTARAGADAGARSPESGARRP